jgi:hypothetical protein
MPTDMRSENRERWPWFDPPYWEEARERFEQLVEDEDDAVARAGVYFELYSLQLFFTLTPFRLKAIGRPPSGADGWLSMRHGVEVCEEIIEASAPLATVGFGTELERNRQIVNRALQLIDGWERDASEEARETAKSERERLMTRDPERARACSTKKGPRQPWGDRSKELGHETHRGPRDSHLQHPRDNDFRAARQGIEDVELLELVDAWIKDLERNYAELVRGIPSAWLDHAELAFEAIADVADHGGATSPNGIPSPARMRVQRRKKGQLGDEEAVVTWLLVLEQGISPQPDGITVAPRERWWIQGRLSDGTLMPCWGTYRVANGGGAAMT